MRSRKKSLPTPVAQVPVPSLRKVNLRLSSMLSPQALLSAFRMRAAAAGWTTPEINRVVAEATSGDCSRLYSVLARHCENGGF